MSEYDLDASYAEECERYEQWITTTMRYSGCTRGEAEQSYLAYLRARSVKLGPSETKDERP